MQGEVALVHEQGQDFAILAVKNQAISSHRTRKSLSSLASGSLG
jgi:hypothetical protein